MWYRSWGQVNFGTVESGLVQRQERQIVQSQLNLDDFLP